MSTAVRQEHLNGRTLRPTSIGTLLPSHLMHEQRIAMHGRRCLRGRETKRPCLQPALQQTEKHAHTAPVMLYRVRHMTYHTVNGCLSSRYGDDATWCRFGSSVSGLPDDAMVREAAYKRMQPTLQNRWRCHMRFAAKVGVQLIGCVTANARASTFSRSADQCCKHLCTPNICRTTQKCLQCGGDNGRGMRESSTRHAASKCVSSS